jgi:hypothetical protein
MMTLTQFTKASHIDASLIRATVRQFGGFESFKESYSDVNNHGISGGFGDFIYYHETVKFALKHRSKIIELLKETSESIGETGLLELVQSFNCLGKADYTLDEIGEALYGSKPKAKQHQQVLNALAWFTAEEVCRSFESVGEL